MTMIGQFVGVCTCNIQLPFLLFRARAIGKRYSMVYSRFSKVQAKISLFNIQRVRMPRLEQFIERLMCSLLIPGPDTI